MSMRWVQACRSPATENHGVAWSVSYEIFGHPAAHRLARYETVTEAQSGWARDLLADLPGGSVLELCCGAGHIGLLAMVGNSRALVMVDASEAACEFARANARTAGLADRVEVRHGRLENCVGSAETFPLVIADPPWVPSNDVDRFPDDPLSAIDGGHDGLGPTRACLAVIGTVLHERGLCVLQVGSLEHVAGVSEW